ncbi:sodium:solute symporter [Telluribacter sp. SYSU D00476]|uniref:sodium:solute symporter family protein n=1 Tax=Telluribacter sp. SYSU D00476 TaxID=2811430 RepID=UPI001FF1D626|nr:sodium:solute symporter family protein [Telluribacter sp. SYSU D00476]
MKVALLVIGLLYIAILVALALYAHKKNRGEAGAYLLAGGNLGAALGFFTFAATLFSAFTLMGMPDFFRTHGVGGWIFLGISDTAMVFGIISLGYLLRKKASEQQFKGMSELMSRLYGHRLAGITTLVGAFLFLIPYVAVQIRGVAIFLNEAFPDLFPAWGWSLGIVVVMLLYSETGGLKAIIYSDTLQSILLIIAIWILGIGCLRYFGGAGPMFAAVGQVNEQLLSVPGPKGLLTTQFLLASVIPIVLIPFTQPQVAIRLVIMKDDAALFRMALGVGVFAIVVILPTAFMGMYGAVRYPDATTSEYLGRVLIFDQHPVVAAVVIIGLVAAAISTADSQIFALGTELNSLLTGDERSTLLKMRLAVFLFALIALVFSILSSDQLVLLARTSFAGTALMAPMTFLGLFSDRKHSLLLPVLTLTSMAAYIATMSGILPDMWAGIRSDLALLVLLAVVATAQHLLNPTPS